MRHLADNAFVTVDLLIEGFLLTGKAVGRHAPEAAVLFADIQRGHGAAQVLRTELQDVAPQQIEAQLPQHLFSQFGLAIAQPGLLLQAMGAGLLRGKVGAVTVGQIEQVATANVSQQATDASDEQQVETDAPDCRAPHLIVTGGAQLLLHVDHVFELLADLIGQALAFPSPYRAAIIAAGSLQIDHALRIIGPFLLQRLQAVQTVGLGRVVACQFEQGFEHDLDSRLRRFIGFEKFFVTAEQEAAHAGFQIDRQLERFIGVIDHSIRVLDPLDRRQQVHDQRNEEHRTDNADTQREPDIAAQEFAEPLLIN